LGHGSANDEHRADENNEANSEHDDIRHLMLQTYWDHRIGAYLMMAL
jgi:hypothetical protein